MAGYNISKNNRSIPDMVGDLRKPVDAIADALVTHGEELKQSTPDDDAERHRILTPDFLSSFYVVRERHRPLDRIIVANAKTIKRAMGDTIYYECNGWEVLLGEQPRQTLNQERLISDFPEVYGLCQHMIVARILNVRPPKGFHVH